MKKSIEPRARLSKTLLLRLPRVACLLALSLAAPLRAACPTEPVKRTRDPIEVTIATTWTAASNSDPSECTIHGPVTIRVKSGTALASTFGFKDGQTVIINWVKKTVEGSYTDGVTVDFKKGRADFAKALVRLELVTKSFASSQKLHAFSREQILAGVEEDDIAFLTE